MDSKPNTDGNPAAEPTGSPADRQCVRVAAPQGLLLEAALWARPRGPLTRLHLADLGRPDLRYAAGDSALRLDDVSANGLRLTLERPEALGPALDRLTSDDCLCLLYLKLGRPLSSAEEQPLALFLGATPVAARADDGRLALALNILYRAQPERDDKALTFFNVSRRPIRELAAWCDEAARLDHAEPRPAFRGLHLSRLLAELDALAAQAEAAAPPETE